MVKQIAVKGTPLLMNETLWSAGLAILLQCYSVRGLNVVAGMNISNTITNVFAIIYLAMGEAVAIIVGQQLGANRIEKAKDTARKMAALSVFIYIIIGSILFLIAPLFPGIYNTSEEAKRFALHFIRITAIYLPINAFVNAAYFALRSGGKTIITFLFDSAFIYLVSVPTAFILCKHTGLSIEVCYAIVTGVDMVKVLIGIYLLKKGKWAQNIVAEERS